MDTPTYFERFERHAAYRPLATVTLPQGVELLSKAIVYAWEQRIGKLLIDTTGLVGFDVPFTWERFDFSERFAFDARGIVRIAFVARPEMIDPKHFGLLVASNRGLVGNVFTTEAEALTWLLAPGTE